MRQWIDSYLLSLFCNVEELERNENESNTIISRPTDTPPIVEPQNEPSVNYFGRRIITASLDKKDLNANSIMELLPQVLREHDKNASEIDYLYNYYKGKQPILNKVKVIRPEINNKVLENHAFEIVEFKKSYVYGEPIQYVKKGETETETINPEISELNEYMEEEDKATRDKEIGEWDYIAGTAYRWIDINTDGETDSPFIIRTPDPRRTFVVYNSGIKGEQLFSGHYSWFSPNIQEQNSNSVVLNKYRIITIYTEDRIYTYKESLGNYELLSAEIPMTDFNDGIENEKKITVDSYPLVIKGHRIIEYPLNNARLGLVELVMSALNAINAIKSNDLDGIEQFVQSLLVFINQEIDIETFKALVAAGAIEVSTNDPGKPADVKLLTSQLLHSETKIVTDDLYNNALTIAGVPRLNNKPSGGDTGSARLLGEGWTMADERAKQDELTFKKSEKKILRLALKICQYVGKLETLEAKDIDIKFTRNKSDNLLVKTQGLMNMKESQVTPEIAFGVCGLFSDPTDAYERSKKFYGDDFWINIEKNVEPNDANQDGTTHTQTSTAR